MSIMSPAERARERAVAIAVLADLALCGPFVAVAIWSGSLTMIADGVRGTLLICVGLVSYATLRNINRRRTGNFEYGTAKLEQAVSILIAMMLVVAACSSSTRSRPRCRQRRKPAMPPISPPSS